MKIVQKSKPKMIVGKTLEFSLPDLDMSELLGKVDTGAQSSCLHCQKVWEKECANGEHELFVELRGRGLPHKVVSFKHYSRTVVRSSFGDREIRYKARLRVQAHGRTFRTEFSFSDRTHMTYAILLGRCFLRGRFIVDVSIA